MLQLQRWDCFAVYRKSARRDGSGDGVDKACLVSTVTATVTEMATVAGYETMKIRCTSKPINRH
ncbi:hypothetical protein JWG39_15045 [Desulforhopalus vacuolatus]|uniref:hypothetical protein n=1 Tax=Desulforhopalus vacuolatus TaxID=40414 RepID=UPI001965740E|nr:hypothetical protein [Desulforhopalus vacuolatus]MBM9521137.1 hypothetical protein [Desulforhopalus vacuolatus]